MKPNRLFSKLPLILFCLCAAFIVTSVLTGCNEETALRERQKLVDERTAAVLAGNETAVAYWNLKIDEADAKIAAVKNDTVATTAEGVKDSPLINFVPDPFRIPVVLGIGLFASIWRTIKWKQAAVSIGKSMEKAMPESAFQSDSTVALIDANQTPMGKAAVDIAQGKSVSLVNRLL